MATYTVEEARAIWEKDGDAWTPEVEARLRERGIIQQPAAPPVGQTPADLNIPFLPRLEPVDKFTATPEWAKTYGLSKMAEPVRRPFGEQMKMAVQSLAQYVPGQYGYDPQERIETGTSSGDLLVDAGLRAGSMGLLSSERLGGDAPGPITNQGQLAMSALGTGGGMIGPLRALSPAAAMTAARIVPSVAAPYTALAAREAAMRMLLGSGLTLGGYEAMMPGSAGERLSRAGHGFQTGVALAGVPAAVGASNPLARKAVEFGTMYGLGATQGMPADENLIQSIAMMLPAEALHAGQAVGGASKAAKPARQTPEQAQAAIEALEARLLNEQAPAQAEIAARVEPFRAARGALQGMEVPAAPRPEIGRPFQPEIRQVVPEGQYDRTLARIQAMRSRQAAPDPAPEQPLVRPPAQMEIPLEAADNRTILLRPDGTVEPAPQRQPMDVGTGTPPEKPVFTGPVIDGEPTPGTVQESMQRFNYEGSMRDAEARRTARETRGQRRARLQAEASAVNAEAQAKLDAAAATQSPPPAPAAPRPTTPRLDMMGGSQVFEAAARALKGVAAEVKDTPRRLKNIKASAETDWDAARAERAKNVGANPLSVPFSKANRDEQTYEDAVAEVVSSPLRVRKLDDLRAYPEKATAGVMDIIDTDNLAALRADIGKESFDRISRAPGHEIKEQLGGTDPVRKTQEIMDGEFGSAVEAGTIWAGNEIDMATHAYADRVGIEYRDLKRRTGIDGKRQLEIAGDLARHYISRNRGHINNDLEFVRDPEVRKLLIESGNPEGMLEYVKGARAIMDKAGNLYNQASKAMGGEGLGDIAAYFPVVPVKPKFFQVREKVRRAAAREATDPRSRTSRDNVYNPRAQHRTGQSENTVLLNGREVPREWNMETVLEGYLDSMLRGVSGDIALSHSLKLAKVDDILADRAERAGNDAEAKSRRNRAEIIRSMAQQRWNHEHAGFGTVDNWFNKTRAGRVYLEFLTENKGAFDSAKYRMNPRFNLGTQWTSVLNPIMADPVAGLLALRDMGVPGVPNKAKTFAETSYEAKRKARPHSQMRAQIEGTGTIGGTLSSPTTPALKFKNIGEKVFFDGATQAIEAWANKFSALIDWHSTRNLTNPDGTPWTPRQRAMHAGQGVFKTQSAFTFGHRAPWLNSRFIQGNVPAQGYSLELLNQVREALGRTGADTSLYGETNLQQTRRAGAIIMAAILQNVWQNVIFNVMRGKDVEESFDADSIWDATLALPPFISVLLPTGKSGRDMPNPSMPVAQVNMVKNKAGKVVEKAVEGEDVTGAALDLARYGAANWVTGGAFASDLMGGRYDFLMDDEGADAPANTAKARPATPRSSRRRQAIPRR